MTEQAKELAEELSEDTNSKEDTVDKEKMKQHFNKNRKDKETR